MTKASSASFRRWLWPIVIALVAALAIFWAYSPLAHGPSGEPAPERTTSAEGTPAPEGPAVEVTLSDTPMRNVRSETSAEEPSELATGRD